LTVPQSDPTRQPTLHSIEHTVTFVYVSTPANDVESVPPATPPPGALCVCPSCGHAHGGYEPTASALLDCLAAILDTARVAKALVEEEAGL
jgi:hypothetical protein